MDMPDFTAADFRAIRESIGLTQADIANSCGVKLLAVKRWERGENPIPEGVWDVLDEWSDRFEAAIATSVETVMHQVTEMGKAPDVLTLTYYRTQDDYDRYGRDEGPFGFVNAVAREVGVVIAESGFEVRFRYPTDGIVEGTTTP